MITEYRVLGSLGIGTGILFLVGGFNCVVFHAPPLLTAALSTAAVIVTTFGCTNYARGKGFGWWLGLTALIPPVGIVLVSILPDRCPEEPTEVMKQLQEARQQAARQKEARQKREADTKQSH